MNIHLPWSTWQNISSPCALSPQSNQLLSTWTQEVNALRSQNLIFLTRALILWIKRLNGGHFVLRDTHCNLVTFLPIPLMLSMEWFTNALIQCTLLFLLPASSHYIQARVYANAAEAIAATKPRLSSFWMPPQGTPAEHHVLHWKARAGKKAFWQHAAWN